MTSRKKEEGNARKAKARAADEAKAAESKARVAQLKSLPRPTGREFVRQHFAA